MKKTCPVSGKTFEITDADLKFYEKMDVPPPTLCPEERFIRRLAFRNRRKIYKRKCDATGKSIISMYTPNTSFPVYHLSEWNSDKFDPLEYGREFDFGRSFFEQFLELSNVIPHPHAAVTGTNENSEFCNGNKGLRNCYLVFNALDDQDCFYCDGCDLSNNCVDNLYINKSELCYECVECFGSYQLFFSIRSKNCSNSWFLRDCIGCSDCFGCTNLRNKKYYFANQSYSKEEYEKKIKELDLDSFASIENLKSYFQEFSLSQPHKFASLLKCENVVGDNLENCKNCESCFNCESAEDCKYCFSLLNGSKDCFDASFFGLNANLCYETANFGDSAYNLRFCNECWSNVQDLTYCIGCLNSKDCFGCFGLKDYKQYCILNKQYTKEEYEVLVPKIIEHMKKFGEWGEFFPIEMSPFAYNETAAQEYFPSTKEECLKKGWAWRDEDIGAKYQGPKYQIPDNIEAVSDDIFQAILECKSCSKNYRIVKPELQFYQKINLPIPHKCPDCRHMDRMKLRNPRQLFDRTCDKCGVDIQTTFHPLRPEKVFCENCYLSVVD